MKMHAKIAYIKCKDKTVSNRCGGIYKSLKIGSLFCDFVILGQPKQVRTATTATTFCEQTPIGSIVRKITIETETSFEVLKSPKFEGMDYYGQKNSYCR